MSARAGVVAAGRVGSEGEDRSWRRPATASPSPPSEGAIDAASILKPMLARGELQTIGVTTLDECRR